jgi:hypothetical protein
MNNINLKKALDEVGKDLVKTMVKKLIDANKEATGKLIRSVDYKLVETANGVIVQLLAADYLKVVDEGRRPGAKQPPTKALDRWVIAKGIAPRDKKGKFISRESVKFLIARSIGKKGIKPTNVITKTINEVYANKQKLIVEAAGKDIENLIAMTFDNLQTDLYKK